MPMPQDVRLSASTDNIGDVDILTLPDANLARGGAVVTRVATGAAASAIAANAARKAITFQNVHATEAIWIAETAGKATAAAGYRIAAGTSVKFDRSTNEWFAFSAAASDLAIVQEA